MDQALDANYRAGVAKLIQRQAESKDAPAQFITTTFRPELVDVSHKCYGIALQNKVSSIYALDKSEAQSFVTNLMNEEEAVGQVSAIPTYSSSLTSLKQVSEEEEEENRSSPIARGGRSSRGGRGKTAGYIETGEDDEDEDHEEEERGGAGGEDDLEESSDDENLEMLGKKKATPKRGRGSSRGRLQKMSIED